MRALKTALAVLLALGVLAAGTLLPQKLLQRRAAGYGAMTAQAAVADIHPYGDAYEAMRVSLLGAIRAWEAYQNGEAELDVGEDNSYDGSMSETADAPYTFFSDWIEGLADEAFWISTPYNMEQFRLQIPAENAAAYCYENKETANIIVIEPTTGVPVMMEIRSAGWLDTELQAVWDALLTAYQSHAGLQFVERTTVEEQMAVYGDYSAVSADQSLRLDMSIIATADSYMVKQTDYYIRVEMRAEE